MSETHDDKHEVEQDPRFPSGEWVGFYLQPTMSSGRVRMDLELTFQNDALRGTGSDRVGHFVVCGTYGLDSGEVSLLKRYLHPPDIHYRGFAEAQHRGVWGIWDIPSIDSGGFRIWPRKHGQGLHKVVSEEQPIEDETALLVGDLELIKLVE